MHPGILLPSFAETACFSNLILLAVYYKPKCCSLTNLTCSLSSHSPVWILYLTVVFKWNTVHFSLNSVQLISDLFSNILRLSWIPNLTSKITAISLILVSSEGLQCVHSTPSPRSLMKIVPDPDKPLGSPAWHFFSIRHQPIDWLILNG